MAKKNKKAAEDFAAKAKREWQKAEFCARKVFEAIDSNDEWSWAVRDPTHAEMLRKNVAAVENAMDACMKDYFMEELSVIKTKWRASDLQIALAKTAELLPSIRDVNAQVTKMKKIHWANKDA